MTIVEPGSARSGLVGRVKSLLLRPAATWDVIDAEPATVGGLYRNYVLPLAAIPAVCGLIGMLAFGVSAFGFTYRPPVLLSVAQAVVSYGVSLAMVFVTALIIEALAPNFGGTKDRIQALKVAAYAPTAVWIAGVFGLVPVLGVVALLGGLYSLYLLYLGLPKLMKTPQEKALPYFLVVLAVAVVITLVGGMVAAGVGALGNPARLGGAGALSGTVSVPGQGEVDLGKLEAASKQLEAVAKQYQEGGGPPATDPEALKAYLPASVGGFTRTEVSASTGGVGGIEGSGAEGVYSKGDARLRLQVVDLGAAAGLAAMAGAFNVKSSKETATGYEKVGKVGGRMTQESYDRASRHGEYNVLVGDRFMVQATGDGVSIDELKGAVNAVGMPRLEALAKGG
jgi:hypothetical protein